MFSIRYERFEDGGAIFVARGAGWRRRKSGAEATALHVLARGRELFARHKIAAGTGVPGSSGSGALGYWATTYMDSQLLGVLRAFGAVESDCGVISYVTFSARKMTISVRLLWVSLLRLGVSIRGPCMAEKVDRRGAEAQRGLGVLDSIYRIMPDLRKEKVDADEWERLSTLRNACARLAIKDFFGAGGSVWRDWSGSGGGFWGAKPSQVRFCSVLLGLGLASALAGAERGRRRERGRGRRGKLQGYASLGKDMQGYARIIENIFTTHGERESGVTFGSKGHTFWRNRA
jgi:hypothetical protein